MLNVLDELSNAGWGHRACTPYVVRYRGLQDHHQTEGKGTRSPSREIKSKSKLRRNKKARDFWASRLAIESQDLAAELERGSLGHFMSARLVGRGVSGTIAGLNQSIGEQVSLNFLATDIRQHAAIDFNAGAEHLAAFFDHFLSLNRIVNDIAVFVGQFVFAHDSPDALAPATRGFQVSNDLWFIHILKFDIIMPQFGASSKVKLTDY